MKPKAVRKERKFFFKADYKINDLIEKEQQRISDSIGADHSTISLAIRNLIIRGAKVPKSERSTEESVEQ